MGGRGSYGGYASLSISSLEKMLSVQETKMREARLFAHATLHSDTSPVIARKIRADTKKYDAALSEAKKIEAALKNARKRKRAVPF